MKSLIEKLIMILAVTTAATVNGENSKVLKVQPVGPNIEVVFVLDTTGSMSGLIAAAREKIWAISNTLATCKPSPNIKMGLIGYRDRSDAYVTKFTNLTDDLDAVYNELMAFSAGGGGDGPESVNQALYEAVTKISWNKDDKTYRVIFLVGDSPPHMDYKDDVKYPRSCQMAAESGIIVNTIQCGGQSATVPIWTQIAKKAEGRYFRVEQSGSAILASTPFDAELAELSKKLDKTRVYYGGAKERAEQETRRKRAVVVYEEAPISAQASRSVFNAGKAGELNFLGTAELVRDVAEGKIKLNELKDEQLDEKLQKMNPEQRQGYLSSMLDKRKDIQKQIKQLSLKRQKHIQAQIKKANTKTEQSLDWMLYKCIKTQAAKKDINYIDGPAY